MEDQNMNGPHRDLVNFELPPEPDDDVPLISQVDNCEPPPPAFSAPVRLHRDDGVAVRRVIAESWRRHMPDRDERLRLQLVVSERAGNAPVMQIVSVGRDGRVRSVVAVAPGDHSAVRAGLEAFDKAVVEWRRRRGPPRGKKETEK